MASDDDLISRADSLIRADAGAAGSDGRSNQRHGRRRRSFVASAAELNGTEELPAAAGDDDDLPLLTEVVQPEMVTEALRPLLAAELSHLLEQRLASETPALVSSALDVAATQLRQGILAAIAGALEDFVAQRGQLSLPLPVVEEGLQPGSDGQPESAAGAMADQL